MSDGRQTADIFERLLAFARAEPSALFALATRVVVAHIRVRHFPVEPDDAAGVAAAIALPLLPLPPDASQATRDHVDDERRRMRKRIAKRRQRLPLESVDGPRALRSLLAKLLLSDADRELQRLVAWANRARPLDGLLLARPAPGGSLDWLLRLRDTTEIPLSAPLREALEATIRHEGDYAAAAAELGLRSEALRQRLCTLRAIILAREGGGPRPEDS